MKSVSSVHTQSKKQRESYLPEVIDVGWLEIIHSLQILFKFCHVRTYLALPTNKELYSNPTQLLFIALIHLDNKNRVHNIYTKAIPIKLWGAGKIGNSRVTNGRKRDCRKCINGREGVSLSGGHSGEWISKGCISCRLILTFLASYHFPQDL